MSLKKGKGWAYTLPKGSSIIRLEEFQTSPEWLSTLNHEIFHVVYATMKHIGIELSSKSEESFAYLISYITQQSLKEIYTRL